MITDRTTAKVLGLLVLLLALLVVVSCFMFARPETRDTPRFPLVVFVTSLPMFAVGGLLLRKASRMKDDSKDDPRA